LSHTRLLLCLFSFLSSPLIPSSSFSFFYRTSKHLNVFLLSTFYHAFSVAGKLYIWYPNKLVFAVAKMPPNPHLHGGIKTLPFFKKATPKTFTYQAPNPRIFGGSLAGRQVEKMVFRQAKRVLL